MTLPIDTSEVVRRWLAGDSTATIAKDLGCCEATVRYRINSRHGCMGRGNLDALTVERIQAMKAKGISNRSIAHELKVSIKSVIRYGAMKDYAGTLAELRDTLKNAMDQGKGNPNKLIRYIEALNAILL